MKKFIATLGIVLLGFVLASAQQIPLYSQYYFNRMVFNPAYTGMENGTSAYLTGRRQWTGINSYETKALAISGSPQGKNIGLGLHYVNDVNSILKTNNLYGNYAYKLKLSNTSQLNFGLSLGVVDSRYDLSNVIVDNADDPVLRLLSTDGGAVMDGSLGAAAQFGNFHIGASVLQLFGSNETFADNVGNQVTLDYLPHYILSSGIKLPIGSSMTLEPMLMYRGVKNAPGLLDVNLMLEMDKLGWLGVAYRADYAMSIMTGLKLADRVLIGYNYDWSISEYSSALGGTHEFMFGYRFVDKAPEPPKKVTPDPRIKKLEAELEELKSKKAEKDTVVLVQKVVERVPAPKEERTEKPKAKPKTTTPDKTPAKVEPDKIDGVPFYILVSGSFTEGAYALAYSNSLKAKGVSNDIHYNAANNTYYVHLGKYADKEKARADIKGKFAGQKVWIKTIE